MKKLINNKYQSWRHIVTPLLKKALFIACLTGLQARAQYSTYSDHVNDRIYSSLATVFSTDPSIQGEGYTIASTALNLSTSVTMKGEISRTAPNGSLFWSYHYTVSGAEVRFNHVEKFDNMGQTNFLLVGSVKYPTEDKLLVAIVDDNGTVLQATELWSDAYPHLLGIKGKYLSDGNFAVVGVESDGFRATDNRNITVFKLDPGLGIGYAYAYSTPSYMVDYDSPNDIIEGATPDELFITGSCNDGPSVLNTMIDMTTGTALWVSNFVDGPGHYNVGVNALYDPRGTGSIWVLANASISHNMRLTQYDYTTGAQLTHRIFGPVGELYGNELKYSLSNPDNFVIAGWQHYGSSVSPFMLEYNVPGNSVVWSKFYPGDQNQMSVYNENDWLKRLASGQFGYYFNRIMDYASDNSGYALLSSDTTYSNTEDVRLWWTIASNGFDNCGTSALTLGTTTLPIRPTINLDPVIEDFHDRSIRLDQSTVAYFDSSCMLNIGKPAHASVSKQATALIATASPNPASDVLKVTLPAPAGSQTSIEIYDILGRLRTQGALDGNATEQSFDVSAWVPGLYLVYVKNHEARDVTKIKVTVMH